MEKLFAFHVTDTDAKKLKQIAGNLKIRCEFVDTALYNQPLESIISGRVSAPAAPFIGDVPEENLLLMCDVSEKHMDRLLLALRKNAVGIHYKAVLTPTNRKWSVLRLMLEMRAEEAVYAKRKPQA